MRSASATIWWTSSTAGIRVVDRPDALTGREELTADVDLGAVGGAEMVGAGGHRGQHLGGERLQLVGVLVEVLGPVVAQDPARLAGVRPRHDGAVLGAGDQGVLVAGDGAGLGSGDEAGADPHSVGAEGERGGEATSVEDAASGDDRDLLADGVDDLRDEGHRGDRAGVSTGLGALGDDEVAAAGDRADGMAHLAAHRGDDDPGVVEGVDDVPRDTESGDEQRRSAIDDVTDPRVDLVR